MEKKEKGAAMVLALLVLMFFMAISLNVFFIAEKQAKKAGVRVVGSKAQSVIDTGSNLGMYEVRTAFRYVRGNMNNSMVNMTSSQGGILFSVAEKVNPVRAGANYIRTSQFHEYFTSFETSPINYNSPATVDTTTPGSVTPSAVAKIFFRSNTNPGTMSIGGYWVESGGANLITNQFKDNPTTEPFENRVEEFVTTASSIDIVMLKRIRTPTVASTLRSGYNAINTMNFQIRYFGTVTFGVSPHNPARKVVTSENVNRIVVINSDN